MSVSALNDSSWNVAYYYYYYFGHTSLRVYITCGVACLYVVLSMGVVGVKSTAGRAVKCVDPSKTTRSESAWLGYPFCDLCYILLDYSMTLCYYYYY